MPEPTFERIRAEIPGLGTGRATEALTSVDLDTDGPAPATARHEAGRSPEILTRSMSGYLFPYEFRHEDADARADVLVSLHGGRTDEPSLGKRFRDAAEARLSLDVEGVPVEATMLQAVAGRTGRP